MPETEDLRFLDAQHDTYRAMLPHWISAERRMRGGPFILEELARYDYEAAGDGATHYDVRRSHAAYHPWPHIFATVITGHLFRNAPSLERGLTLGPLQEKQRDLVMHNLDGVGNDGSEWNAWWKRQMRYAMATGHRWLYCDLPPRPANRPPGTQLSLADEQAGMRPYLVGCSPISVPMWHYELGRLDFAIRRVPRLRPQILPDSSMDNTGLDYLLLVRQGVSDLGDRFKGGGWWRFSPRKELYTTRGDDGSVIGQSTGEWKDTDGEIPFWPLYYERDDGLAFRLQTTGGAPTIEGTPVFSRSGTFELGQLAVGHMNMQSAADSDAIDAAKSIIFLLGASDKTHGQVLRQVVGGSQIVGVPTDEESEKAPTIYDSSSGAVVAAVFEGRDRVKRQMARDLAAIEATSAPDSSGESKFAGWFEMKVPRLVDAAVELQSAMTTGIFWLGKRFGYEKSDGTAKWALDFDMQPLVHSIRETFEIMEEAGVKVPVVMARLFARFLIDRNLLPAKTEDELAKALNDEELDGTELYRVITEAATAAAERSEQMSDLMSDFRDGGNVGRASDRTTGGAPPAPNTNLPGEEDAAA